MRAYDIIAKKRDGLELTGEEINYFIQGFTTGKIPDYQMSALAMAIFIRGMNERETADLTMAMVNSGDSVDLSQIKGIKVDKHSTGGVGDTTTLVLAPLVAAAGAPVAKMSGRGLGHTGGTLDKFESIPGFRVELSQEEFLSNVNKVKVAVVGQTGNLAPADKKLYALRDVTATVNSIPLIASSIMSKKLAAGADAIVLDVKTGSGAFMKDLEDSRRLARAMVDIGKQVGRRTVAIITTMEQPLGFAIGNALEVKEAVDTLRGGGPADLRELCLTLGAQMLELAGVVSTVKEGRNKLEQHLADGTALAKFKEMVTAQGGDARALEDLNLLPQAKLIIPVPAQSEGFIQTIDGETLGLTATLLGAGRETKDDRVDPAVGLIVHKKIGDVVKKGETLVTIHANDMALVNQATARIQTAYQIGSSYQPAPILVLGEII